MVIGRSRGCAKGALFRFPVNHVLCVSSVVRNRVEKKMAFINPSIAVLKTWYGIVEIALRVGCTVC